MKRVRMDTNKRANVRSSNTKTVETQIIIHIIRNYKNIEEKLERIYKY